MRLLASSDPESAHDLVPSGGSPLPSRSHTAAAGGTAAIATAAGSADRVSTCISEGTTAIGITGTTATATIRIGAITTKARRSGQGSAPSGAEPFVRFASG